ncbi:uncharacterized protein K460DRAFT_152556 [Cucurbitaria berberidis CBS 394.84]|uniref:Uncharacterized protein n=1 Tax=Cucurbitaria berberidis CBS 394.84 TaxID=1168544 RepID=A0A9P4GDC9_9PLEO|nr:uncharacterized protein K460DRAFT_152556 [Cucurbitaria berberidis CBS 394.84]KAF1843853.1 hypothetical protein K460DRAFT_152556 [Cucurbitaria berberidis CBS 394.84]
MRLLLPNSRVDPIYLVPYPPRRCDSTIASATKDGTPAVPSSYRLPRHYSTCDATENTASNSSTRVVLHNLHDEISARAARRHHCDCGRGSVSPVFCVGPFAIDRG